MRKSSTALSPPLGAQTTTDHRLLVHPSESCPHNHLPTAGWVAQAARAYARIMEKLAQDRMPLLSLLERDPLKLQFSHLSLQEYAAYLPVPPPPSRPCTRRAPPASRPYPSPLLLSRSHALSSLP